MHQRQIFQGLSKETGIPQARVREVVDAFLTAMAGAVKAGEAVEVPDFGVFTHEVQEPRWVKPPGHPDKIAVPGRRRIRFEPHREIARRLDNPNPAG